MCHGHHQRGALGTELLKDGQPKEVQLTVSHIQLVPGGQTGLSAAHQLLDRHAKQESQSAASPLLVL